MIGHLLLRGRWAILAVVFALTAAAVPLIPQIGFDFSFARLFYNDSPDVDVLRAYLDDFGQDVSSLVVLVEVEGDGDLFTADRLGALREIVDGLNDHPDIESVDALTTLEDLRGADGVTELVPFVPEDIATDAGALAALRKAAVGHPILDSRVLSSDGRATAIIATFYAELQTPQARVGVIESVEALLADRAAAHRAMGLGTAITGVPYVQQSYFRVAVGDQKRMIPTIVAILAVLVFAAFRSVVKTVLALTPVLIALVWTLAFAVLTGEPVNMINGAIPSILLVIGIADSIHLVARYEEELRLRGDPMEAVRHAFAHMAVACFLTSLTTGIGFASLATAELPVVRNFGLYAAAGIVCAYLVVISLVPATLAIAKPAAGGGRRGSTISDVDDTRVGARLADLGTWVLGRRRAVLAATAAVTVVALFGASQARIRTGLIEELKAEHPASQALRRAEEALTGVLSASVYIRGESPNAVADPEVLRAMKAFQNEIEAAFPDIVTSSFSIAPVIEEAHEAFFDDDPSARRIPDVPAAIPQLLDLVSPELRLALVSEDMSRAHVHLTTKDRGSHAGFALEAKMNALADRLFRERWPDRFQVDITGSSMVANRGISHILWDMLTSLLLAYWAIYFIMVWVFRRPPIARLLPAMLPFGVVVWVTWHHELPIPMWLLLNLMSFALSTAITRTGRFAVTVMVPNMLPLLCTVAAVGFLDVHMRVSTVMIFAIALGIAVDDTIHFLTRYGWEIGQTAGDEAGIARAVRRTQASAGRGILYTSVFLVIGFSVLWTSDFVAMAEFGVLGGVTILSALVADVVVLPALVAVLRPPFRSPDNVH